MTDSGGKSGKKAWAGAAAPAVIAISSLAVRGSVGNRVIVPALQAFGHPVWAVATVTLPWHPGHGPATRIVPPTDRFAALLDDLAGSSWIGEVGAVLTGYLGEPEQAGPVAALVDAVKKANPDALYLCDPVIGDEKGLYVLEATAAAIRDQLLPLADIATPNRFELEWLAGRPLCDNAEIMSAARTLGPARLLVTSAHASSVATSWNLLVTPFRTFQGVTGRLENPPNGPGDLTAALFLANLLAGESDEAALARATGSVHEILIRSVGRDELAIEGNASCFTEPGTAAEVQLVDPAPTESGK